MWMCIHGAGKAEKGVRSAVLCIHGGGKTEMRLGLCDYVYIYRENGRC